MTAVPEYVLTWAAAPGPRELLAEARRRLELGRLGPSGHIALDAADRARRTVGQMLDATWAISGKPVSVRALRAGLAAHGTTLEDLLVAISGPLRDLPAQRRAQSARRTSDRRSALAELVALLDVPIPESRTAQVEDALYRWILRGAPVRQRVDALTRVVAALPTDGERLPVIAARLTGDAHALDRDKGLGRAVARFLAVRQGVRQGADPPEDPLTSAETWRAVWADAGVACDSVSARVLVLNLPLVGTAPAVALCTATPGEPVWLSLRSLSGHLGLTEPQDVYVCENPSIVEAAADRLGVSSRPLVCLFGRPDAAAMTLLRALVPSAKLHVRADGDAVGWGIVDGLLAEFPDAVSWRMPVGTTAYEEELLSELLSDLAPTKSGPFTPRDTPRLGPQG